MAFRTNLDSEIIDALQDAQVELERGPTLPWFLEAEVSSISTVSGEERVKLPSDFIREWDDDPLWYYNASAADVGDVWVPLAKDELEILRETYPGSGAPLGYNLDAKYFRLFPTPDAIYVLKMIYYKHDQVLSTNIENLWLEHYPLLLVGMAGGALTSGTRDKDGITLFAKMEIKNRRIMIIDTEARTHASKRYVMGGPD
jgi:hypothetical protein